jgi:hypothetical protein
VRHSISVANPAWTRKLSRLSLSLNKKPKIATMSKKAVPILTGRLIFWAKRGHLLLINTPRLMGISVKIAT